MTRLFYNSTTGHIESSYSGTWPGEHSEYYIDIEGDINISCWRVNPSTKQLESITPPEQLINPRLK